MLFVSLICISIFFVESPSRTDCYISFSIPAIYIKVSHHFPSGPLYLSAIFRYTRFLYLHDNNPKNGHGIYHFKRFDHNCTSSVLFTTLVEEFEKTVFVIILYIKNLKIAEICYKFNKGFKPGIYKMLDLNQHFLVHTRIHDVKKDYLEISPFSIDDIKHYLNSVSRKDNNLCIITENNRAVVLRFYQLTDVYPDYITGFMAEISKGGKFIGKSVYTAFECTKEEVYETESVIFINDGPNFYIELYVIDINFEKTRIKIENLKFEYVYNLQNISKEAKKVFLMELKEDYTVCPDGSTPYYYISHFNTKYYARVTKEIYISPLVMFFSRFYRSPFDICNNKTLK